MTNFHSHFSNRTENLYQALKGRLFASSDLFKKRMIIVPSAAMKSWLMLQMAKDPEIGICAGLEIGFLEPTIKNLHEHLTEKKDFLSESYEPSELELALALETEITTIAMTHPLLPEWETLIHYLGVSGKEKQLSHKSKQRIRGVAAKIAGLFLEYSVSGGKMVAEWQHSPSEWQSLLWQRMEFIFASWQYPAKKFAEFFAKCSNAIDRSELHVFGLSFITPLHHQFLQKIAKYITVDYYLLSPCQKFWGDILSEGESFRLKDYWDKKGVGKAHLERLEEFLGDRNPLLANFGRLGREMATQMESVQAQSTEIYSLPQSIQGIPCYDELEAHEVYLEKHSHPLTMLEAVQADLTLLREIEKDKQISFNIYDETIQVHAVPKKSREVQVIYDILLSIIDKHVKDEDPILPCDILVMSPNIAEYAPFIRNVFESPESLLSIQVTDLEAPSQYLSIQGFLHLLSLSKGRWEASSLLQLFNFASFRKRHKLNGEEVSIIEKWIKETGIFWGKDDKHRQEIFKQNYENDQTNAETSIGTWEYGLGRLLEGLAMLEDAENETGTYGPMGVVETSQAGLLGKVLFLIRSLKSDLKPLMDGTELSLEKWTAYLKCLFDAYFFLDEEVDEPEAYRILNGHMESFAKASRRLPSNKFSFETIHRHLLEGLKKEKSVYKESNLQSVRFSSLMPMRAVPAKVIVLMGMDDETFPGVDQVNTLNLMFQNPKADYYPSRVDFDRYLFLESILSARSYFILSYTSQVPGESKFKPPSLLVKELLTYVDDAYHIMNSEKKPSEHCFRSHPLIPFHYSYFSKNSNFQSFSTKNYEAAIVHYHEEKKPRRSFIPDFNPCISDKNELQKFTINLKDVLAFAKNPIKVYLNQALGIYLNYAEEYSVKDEEELFLSDLNASILTKQGLLQSPVAALKQGEKTGKIPYGPFKQVAVDKLEKEISRYVSHLKACEVSAETLFTIVFNELFSEPHFSGDAWNFPPITLDIADFGSVKMVGKIENVSSKGLVLFCKDGNKKILENWPSCLVLKYFIEKYSLELDAQMIFLKDEKVKVRKIDFSVSQKTAEDSLKDYLAYYLKEKKAPSPLIPDLVNTIFSGKDEELKELFKNDKNNTFQPQYDPYPTWLQRNSPKAEVASSLHHWQPLAQKLFIDIFSKKQIEKI